MRRLCSGSGRGEALRMARANLRACPASRSALGRGRAPETCRGSKMGGGHTSARVVGERRWRLGKGHKRSPRARRHGDVGGSWVPSAVPGLPPARRALTSTGGAVPDPPVAAWPQGGARPGGSPAGQQQLREVAARSRARDAGGPWGLRAGRGLRGPVLGSSGRRARGRAEPPQKERAAGGVAAWCGAGHEGDGGGGWAPWSRSQPKLTLALAVTSEPRGRDQTQRQRPAQVWGPCWSSGLRMRSDPTSLDRGSSALPSASSPLSALCSRSLVGPVLHLRCLSFLLALAFCMPSRLYLRNSSLLSWFSFCAATSFTGSIWGMSPLGKRCHSQGENLAGDGSAARIPKQWLALRSVGTRGFNSVFSFK